MTREVTAYGLQVPPTPIGNRRKWTPAQLTALVQFWSDKNIEPGVAWKDEILEALASCRAALLLVSQDFLTSVFVRTEEVARLEKRAQSEGMKLYWVPLRPSMVKEDTTISKYQALMDITTSLAEIRRNRPKNERTRTELTE